MPEKQREPFERVQPAPSRHNKRKKKHLGKAVLITLVVCSLLLVVAAAGAVYVSQLLNLVDRTPVTGDPDADETDLVHPDDLVEEPDSSNAIDTAKKDYQTIGNIAVPADRQVVNILLIGTDQESFSSRGRSDAMIILSINKRTQKIHLTSLMRAMYVAIPGRDWSMLNHSYAWGGPDLLIETIEDNLRIKIDEYVAINFNGFRQAIDQVGGVNIRLTQAEASHLNSKLGVSHLKSGDNRLNGSEALAYARIRKLDSDFARTGRQRAVMESLVVQSRSLNVMQLNELAQTLLPLVNTSLSQGEMLSLMADLVQARNYPVTQLMLPEQEHRERIYVRKMEMYRFNFRETIQNLHKFIYG